MNTIRLLSEKMSDLVSIENSKVEKVGCPVCGGAKVSGCRCSSRVLPHSLDQFRRGHGNECENGHRWSGDIVIESATGELLVEKSQPKLNKYDPGSLLGWTIHLLEKEGLGDAADEVREISRKISRAWQERER